MDYKITRYVIEYVKKNYAEYAGLLFKGTMLSKGTLLSSVMNDVADTYSVNEIIDGKADYFIEMKINAILASDLRESYDDYNELYSHINSLLLMKYKDVWFKNNANKDVFRQLVRDSIVDVCKLSDYDYKLYLKPSKADLIIDDFINKSDKIYDDCFKRIVGILDRCGVKAGCNLKTYDVLLENVVYEMLESYNIIDIVNGSYDKEILKQYKLCLDKLKNEVSDYVKSVIYKIDLPFGIDVNTSVRNMTNSIFNVGEYNVMDLFNGKLDNYIVAAAKRVRKLDNIINARKYILKKITNMNSIEFTEKQLEAISDEILELLRNKYQFGLDMVVAGKCDDVIAKLFDKKKMVYASIEVDDKPRRVRHKSKKKKMPIQQKFLSIVGVIAILSVITPITYNAVEGQVQYYSAVSSMEHYIDYSYPGIYSPDNNNVIPTAIKALDFYNNVKASGYDNGMFCYLGFYSAYDSVRQDKLYVMDEIYRRAVIEACYDDEYIDIREEIRNDSCFLDFVARRLYEMGFVEIKQDKYVDAINAYKKAENNPDVEIPMNSDMISKEHKDVIEEIMKLYREYSKKYVLLFDKVLPEMGGFKSNGEEIKAVSNRRNV